MDDILKYILKYCSSLYKDLGFRFINSEVSKSFGDAGLILANEEVSAQFLRDRGDLFLDFQNRQDGKRWFSLDVVKPAITGEHTFHGKLNDENGVFLEQNMKEIVDLFSNANYSKAREFLKKLEKEKGKKMFG
jgi:hypothetical protein